MDQAHASNPANSFSTFGDLLKYLRRRAHLTQLELSIAVGYSEAQISRLEQNQRLPDIAALKALFIPALQLEDEPELAARLLELAQSARQVDAPAPGLSPYKGLLFFDEADAGLFFGRETLTERLTGCVMDLAVDASTRFLAVVGASGSGKSSLVRAGLAVALRRAGWDVRVFTPTVSPLRMLDIHLHPDRTNDAERILILVDQFEELFTLCHYELERIGFIERLLSSAEEKSKKTTVVIALRADFYSYCAQYPALREAVAGEQIYIGQMTLEELRCAIEKPARRSGWELEPGLIDILLTDISMRGSDEPEPGVLPLLSHALLVTWQRRRGRTITLDGYRASGGIRRAIAETAESVFTDQLNLAQQKLAQEIFLRLTELGESTEDTRRRATLNELVRQTSEAGQVRVVLNTLAEARLITLNEDSAEVAHEALIREWQRLREWLTQDREGLLLHRHLTEAAREWKTRRQDPAELYRGARLAQIQEWALANDEKLNQSEQAFLKASLEQEQNQALEREALHQRELEAAQMLAQAEKSRAEENIHSAQRLRVRNRAITIIGILALGLALLASLFGAQSNHNATLAEVNFAKAENLRLSAGADAVLAKNGDPELAALLSIRALQSNYSIQADAALIMSLENLNQLQLLKGHTREIYSVAFSTDEKYILSASQDGSARIWDVQNGQEIRQLTGHKGGVSAAAFSPDGKFIITGGNDQTARLWDAQTGQQLRVFQGSSGVTAAVFSPDGKLILTNGEDNAARLWDAQTRQMIRDFVGHTDFVSDIAFSPDGKYVLTGSFDRTARIWEIATGKQLTILAGNSENSAVTSVAFSPDGRYALTGHHDRIAKLWIVNTGKEALTLYGHSGPVNDVAFSPDGQYALTASEDQTVRLWDVKTGQEVRQFYGPQAGVKAVAFSPDGRYVASGGYDNIVRLWSVAAKSSRRIFRGHTSSITSVAFSPNGRYALTGSSDATARLWDIASGKEIRILTGHTKTIDSVAFSPDGIYALTGSLDTTARLWNVETGKLVHILTDNPPTMLINVAFSPDNRYALLMGASFSGSYSLWDIKSGQKIRVINLRLSGPNVIDVKSIIAFTPNSKFILSGPGVINAETGKLVRLISAWDVNSLALSPDGKYVLTGDNRDKTVRLWDFATGQGLHTFASQAYIWSVAFSPDGRYALAGLDNNIADLWDLATRQELRQFIGHKGPVNAVAFSPDGKYIFTGSGDDTARLWDTDYHDTIRYACSLLQRDFTDKERKQYVIADNKSTCSNP